MFLGLGLVLLLLWIGGFVVFHVSAFVIHILLILAVISIIFHFMSGICLGRLSLKRSVTWRAHRFSILNLGDSGCPILCAFCKGWDQGGHSNELLSNFPGCLGRN